MEDAGVMVTNYDGATRWAPWPLVSLLGNEQASLTVCTGHVLQTQQPGFWKGSLRFWSTAQDFVLIFFFKHWLCGDRSQQSSLSSKSSDYRILHLQHRGQETVGEVLGHFSLSLRENIWQGQKRTTSQPDHFPIHQHSFPLASCWPFLTGQAVYCSKLATGPPFYFSFMKLTFFGGNQATKHRLLN